MSGTYNAAAWTGRAETVTLAGMLGIRRMRDRLDTHQVGPWWLRLTWINNPRGFAGYVLYFRRRRLVFKPINYGTVR